MAMLAIHLEMEAALATQHDADKVKFDYSSELKILRGNNSNSLYLKFILMF